VFKTMSEKVLLGTTFSSPTSLHIEPANKNKVDVILVNHISTVDFIMLLDYLYDHGVVKYRFVLKESIVCIPGIGQLMYFGNNVIVKRNWQMDQKTIWKDLDNLPNASTLILFPEGTRMSEEKLFMAQTYSMQHNLPIFENLLVPKFHGAWNILSYLKTQHRLGKLYDVTLVPEKRFQKKSMFLSDIFQPSGIGQLGFHVRKLNTEEIPHDYDLFCNWFLNRWLEKDYIFKSAF